MLYDETKDVYSIINRERANKQFTPYSSFKIANTLIALDTQVVESLDQELTFNLERYPIKKWWPKNWYQSPLVIREAFQYSALPIYQTIALEIGELRMREYLQRFKYGNQDISSGIDNFWLNKNLKISAKQQIEFLRQLNHRKLNLKPSTFDDFFRVMLVSQNNDFELYAKTGGGPTSNNTAIGWYVGLIKKQNNTYYFALNITGKSFNEIKDKRKQLVNYHLKEAGVL